jgi:hypothetical protein
LETWRPEINIETSQSVLRALAGTQSPDDPYYNDVFPKNIRAPEPRNYVRGQIPATPFQSNHNYYGSLTSEGQGYHQGYQQGYTHGHYAGYEQSVNETSWLFSKAAFIIECERIRLVNFLRSLRQTLDILNDDPLMVEDVIQIVTPGGKPTNGYKTN